MAFCLTADQQLLRRTVREFAEAEIRPHVMEWDQAQHFPVELVPKLASLGLLGIQWPEQYGGAGMSAADYCICIEELARVDPAVALSVAGHNGLCAAHTNFFGSEEQKQTYLGPLARGEQLGAWGLTESSSGSDAAGMRTTAARAGDCWVLNGSKTFTTHGRVGDTMVVMAVTDRAAGTKGISAFIAEKGTPGMTPGKKEDKLGRRASDTSEVLFENCRLPADPMEACRRRHAHRGGAPAHVPRRVPEGPRRQDDAGVVDGEAVCERDGSEGGRGRRANPRWLRVREGLSGREVFPRRKTDDH